MSNIDGPGQFTIELHERVYTLKAETHELACLWIEGLHWRQEFRVGMTMDKPELQNAHLNQDPSQVTPLASERLEEDASLEKVSIDE